MAKEMLSARVSPDTMSRLRDTVSGLQRIQDPGITLAHCVEEAVDAWIQAVEVEHNGGRPFAGGGSLPVGRRIGGPAGRSGDE